QLGNRVGDDAAAGLGVECLVVGNSGADGDGGVHVAVPGQVAHGAAVDAALFAFQLVDDFHRANFRRAGQCARGQGCAQDVHGRDAGLDAGGDVGGDVHDVGVALHHHFFRHFHAADFRHPADVVAAKVD